MPTYRPATVADASQLAKLSILAGGGTFELLLQGLKRNVSVQQVMTTLCAAPNTEYSFRHCFVAQEGDRIAGVINFLTVNERYLLAPNINPILRREFGFGWWQLLKFLFRARHLKGMNVIKAPRNAMHINDVAVFPEFGGQGISKQLVQHVIEQAKKQNCPCISLYVWADNTHAIEFYQHLGFELKGKATVRPHKYLPHTQSLLMLYKIPQD